MKKLPRGNIHRTTFDQVFEGKIPHVGIYIIAYMGHVLYVGKAEHSVAERMENHLKRYRSRIGIWLRQMEFDWHNVRLDIIEPPPYQDHLWLVQAEIACIRKFLPLFNDKFLPDKGSDNSQLSKAIRKNHLPHPQAV